MQAVFVTELVNEGGRRQAAVARSDQDGTWVLVDEMAELPDPNRQRLTATVGGVHVQPGRPVGLHLFSFGRSLEAVGDDQAAHFDSSQLMMARASHTRTPRPGTRRRDGAARARLALPIGICA